MEGHDIRLVLAQNIKARRKELGITQMKLAELAEISEPYMNDIERCQTWISDKTLAKLAKALHMGVSELFEGHIEQKQTDKKEIYKIFLAKKAHLTEYIAKYLDEVYDEIQP